MSFEALVLLMVIVGVTIATQRSRSASSTLSCKHPMDIRDPVSGVQVDKISGSRAEYFPFPSGFTIIPGHSLSIEFRSDSPSGLIFLAGNFDMADMVSAYLRKGHVTFARRCSSGRVFEIYPERMDDGKWHSLTYFHGDNGGSLFIDNVNPFRHYHIGPCSSFSAAFFGGMTTHMSAGGYMGQGPTINSHDSIKENETVKS